MNEKVCSEWEQGLIKEKVWTMWEQWPIKKLPPMLMRSGQGNINLSMCTMALRNKGEESVRKRKKTLELRLGWGEWRVERQQPNVYAVGTWNASCPQQSLEGRIAGYYPGWKTPRGTSMILLRTGTILMIRFELCENSDQQKLPLELRRSE